MKICYVSDVHFEINGLGKCIGNWEPADVLLLGGDTVSVASLHPKRNDPDARSVKKAWNRLKKDVLPNYRKVFLVIGNHEHYHGVFKDTENLFREYISEVPNARLLENNAELVDDVLFLGCTLWTDFLNENPMAMMAAQQGMNDYNLIYKDEVGGTRITPQDTLDTFKKSKEFLMNALEDNPERTTVILTHHCPSYRSNGPRQSVLSPCYSSSLDELVLDNPQISHWVHGHTHYSCKYKIGETNVISNQCGYYIDPSYLHFSPQSFFEVDYGATNPITI